MDHNGLAYHPIADAFPMMSEQELDDLAQDIKARGLQHPVVLYEGKILDGRNRSEAAKRGGVPITHEAYDGDDPVGFVISLNIKRRHLDQSQRAMAASKLAELPRGRPSENASIDALTVADAAALMNVSEPSVERAKVVRRKGAPELVTAVEKGEIAVSTAADLARLPEPEQRNAIEGGKKAAAAVAKKVREAKKRALSAIAPPAAVIDPTPSPFTAEHLLSLWNAFRDAYELAPQEVRAEFEHTKRPLADGPATPVPVEAAAALTPRDEDHRKQEQGAADGATPASDVDDHDDDEPRAAAAGVPAACNSEIGEGEGVGAAPALADDAEKKLGDRGEGLRSGEATPVIDEAGKTARAIELETLISDIDTELRALETEHGPFLSMAAEPERRYRARMEERNEAVRELNLISAPVILGAAG